MHPLNTSNASTSNQLDLSLSPNIEIKKNKLAMVWVKKIGEDGREYLAAVWTNQD